MPAGLVALRDSGIDKAGITTALKVARHALAGKIDYSGGACFWDGKDLKTNPDHPKRGKTVKGAERGRDTAAYESTAAYGGTVFWRLTPAYVEATGNKVYR
ncbi:hypothetical protein [Nevskia sp.]|uniref:hypothetical protein n=1 Tax=Nevskia sp. TaxID=1929292 RepID=UPI0025D4E6F8|nr:hypothetical protein [Nevskia sp.]